MGLNDYPIVGFFGGNLLGFTAVYDFLLHHPRGDIKKRVVLGVYIFFFAFSISFVTFYQYLSFLNSLSFFYSWILFLILSYFFIHSYAKNSFYKLIVI